MSQETHSGSGPATASLVLGIISVIFGVLLFIPLADIICAIVGLVMYGTARRRGFSGPSATAGLVCSILGLILGLVTIAVFVAGFIVLWDDLPNLLPHSPLIHGNL